MFDDTIAAVITAPGIGAMGALRVSGPDAFRAVSKVFRGKNGREISALSGYSLTYGSVFARGVFLDQALLLKMNKPHSFTGEDVAELQCHGGPYVMSRLMEELTSMTEVVVRAADPGEFSRRAFLNGKMDLSQAEAVMELVTANNPKAAFLAASQMAGSLTARLRSLEDGILDALAEIEVGIDFPEEDFELQGGDERSPGRGGRLNESDSGDISVGSPLERTLSRLLTRADELLACADRGRIYREGIKVVFFGKPNTGKSSLLNGILNEPRAIVTPEPGTTRDVLEERILLKGLPLVLTDTAGVRASLSEAESAGVHRAKDRAAKADLVLYIVDLASGLTGEDEALLAELDAANTIIVFNKSDLADAPGTQAGERAKAGSVSAAGKQWRYCRLSALIAEDLDFLATRIRAFFDNSQTVEKGDELIINRRQSEALLNARQSLRAAVDVLRQGAPEDLAAIDLRQAWSYLGELTGASLQPSLIDRVFSTFCLGK